ncbi:MAG: type I toxin-antitoxin system Fst family toxin [Alkalibacterium sp.]|nr:type I toxin-antitoxin system Fst family toxin [Alkalibacterium sp.]
MRSKTGINSVLRVLLNSTALLWAHFVRAGQALHTPEQKNKNNGSLYGLSIQGIDDYVMFNHGSLPPEGVLFMQDVISLVIAPLFVGLILILVDHWLED